MSKGDGYSAAERTLLELGWTPLKQADIFSPTMGWVPPAPTTRITEPEFVDALAEGQHMTEAGTEALMAGEVVMVHPEPDAYIETLERAVLASWEHSDDFGDVTCGACSAWVTTYKGTAMGSHAPGCIVPALLAKYEPA